MVQTERGCLVMTDLTGYTGYLTGAELNHAEGVLADLLETVIGALRPVLKLAKLEGDAAFAYAPAGKIDGPMLLDVVEQCYFSFQRRRRDVRQATTCQCNACAQIASLNLKVFVHDGEFVRHRIAGREELAGADVILVHRLLKNTVAERFGLQGYALLTDACLRAAGIDPVVLGMREHRETYEHIGEVPVFVHDLQTRWSDEQERRRVFIAPEKSDGEISFDLQSPPALVWDYLTSPAKRLRWQPVDGLEEHMTRGRRGPGTTNRCAHGNQVVVEEVLDWRPFDYFTVRFVPMGFPIDETAELIPTEGGTRVSLRQKIPRSKKAREGWSMMREQYDAMMRDAFASLATLIAQEIPA
ncbi:MAG: DUF2652 domain-containing protein, partial [Armatimonadota bacterium]